MKKTNMDLQRRKFIIQAASAGAALAILPAAAAARFLNSAHAEEKLPEVQESDPIATSLGYHKVAAKVDVKKWPKRAGAAGKKQFCDNCVLYTPTSKTQGKCQIFSNKVVEAKGWCNSWSQKA